MQKLVWLAWLLACALVLPRAAHAETPLDLAAARADLERASTSSDAEVAAAGLYFLGDMDDAAFDFAGAVAHYGASLARLPSSRYATRAAARKRELESHAEGGFVPLLRLERLRRDPVLSNDPAAIEALVRDADDFPPGPVRVESRLLAAEAYRGRLHRPDAELSVLWKVVRDPYADALSSRMASGEIVDAELDLGHIAAAERAVHDLGGAIDPRVAAKAARLVRRRAVHGIALVEMALFAGLLAVALLRRRARGVLMRTRRVLPLATAFSLFAAGGGGLLAERYEAGSAGPFLMLGPTMLGAILLSRAWSAVGRSSVAARLARGAVSASSFLAAAFLLVERLTPRVLDGLGL